MGAVHSSGAAVAANGGPTPGLNTVYEVGSLTKSFTALAAQLLEDQGKLSMLSSIQSFLPGTKMSAAVGAITLQELASHISGLPRMPSNFPPGDSFTDPGANYQPADLLAYLSSLTDVDLGPKAFLYSNAAFGLLGYIVTVVTGKSYEDSIRSLITGPLGMPDTSIQLSSSMALRCAKPYFNGQAASTLSFTDAMVGAGGLHSTVADMTIFARVSAGLDSRDAAVAAAAKKLLVHVTADEFTSNHGAAGYSWQRYTARGRPVWWKDGVTNGCNAVVQLGQSDVSVILSNTGDGAVVQLGEAILFGARPQYEPPSPYAYPPYSTEIGFYTLPNDNPKGSPGSVQVYKDMGWAQLPGSLIAIMPRFKTTLLPISNLGSPWTEAYYMPAVTDRPGEVYFFVEGSYRSLVLCEYGKDNYAFRVGDAIAV